MQRNYLTPLFSKLCLGKVLQVKAYIPRKGDHTTNLPLPASLIKKNLKCLSKY